MPRPTNFTFRMDPEVKAKLQQLADEDDRTLGNYIHSVLSHHVRQMDKAAAALEKEGFFDLYPERNRK